MSQNDMEEDYGKDREVNVTRNGDVTVVTEHTEKFNAEQYMEQFKKTIYDYRQKVNQHSNMESEIEERIEDHGQDLEILHGLDSNQDDEMPDNINLGGNNVSKDAIIAYVEMQQYKEQKENLADNLEEIKDDIKDMYPAARKIVMQDNDLEMPKPVKILDFLDSEAFFGGDRAKEGESDGE